MFLHGFRSAFLSFRTSSTTWDDEDSFHVADGDQRWEIWRCRRSPDITSNPRIGSSILNMQDSQLTMIHPWCSLGSFKPVPSKYRTMLRPGGPTLAVQSWLKLKKQQPLMLYASLTIRGDNTHHVIKSPQN